MMYIEYMSNTPRGVSEFEWHIKEQLPRDKLGPVGIVSVGADGDEMEYLAHTLTNIPYNSDKMRGEWTGEMARFIFDNI